MFRFSPFVLLICLWGCDDSRLYELNQDFKDGIWKANDTARFEFAIDDTTKPYNVILNVRNTIDFETVRLFVGYQLSDSAKTFVRKRLVERNLFDRKTGEPFGESGLRSIYDHHFIVEPSIRFPKKGNYQIKLNQMMRTDELKEVLSVGIRIEVK